MVNVFRRGRTCRPTWTTPAAKPKVGGMQAASATTTRPAAVAEAASVVQDRCAMVEHRRSA